VAVLVRLFHRHHVSPVLEPGEKVEEANRRIRGIVDDSEINITLQIKHPEKIRLKWEPLPRV
jgi:hypothetical protein